MVHRLRGPRALATLLVLALSATFATTLTAGAAPATVKAATGVDTTTNTVKIAVLGLDLQALIDAGVVPDLGKPATQFTELQNEINTGGKAGKYKLEVVTKLLPASPKPEDYQADCLWATEEQQAFAVVLASVGDEGLARCIAIDHKTFAISNIGYTAQLYKDAKGLIMTGASNTAMSIDRQMQAWAQVSASQGLLKKQKIGIVVTDANAAALTTIDGVLVPALKKLGYSVTDKIVLPCAAGAACAQQDVAVQKLKNDGITFVFDAAEALAGVELAKQAAAINYKPTWTNNRNNTTDTVAKFYQPVAEYWEGAKGVSVTWPDVDFSQETKDCNAAATKAGVFSYQPSDNAYAAYGQYCIIMNTIAQGIKSVTGDLNTASFTKAMIGLGTVASNSGPAGTWAKGKYDSGDYVYAAVYHKSGNDGKGGFDPVGAKAKPVKIATSVSGSKSTSSK